MNRQERIHTNQIVEIANENWRVIMTDSDPNARFWAVKVSAPDTDGFFLPTDVTAIVGWV